MTEIRTLAKFVRELTWEDVPDQVKEAVKNVVLDSVGVGIGACQSKGIQKVTSEFSALGQKDETAGVWGQNRKMSLENAIFINAMEGHTLELDDVHTDSKTHIGTVVVPAAWGMAQCLESSGQELLLAVLCGYEVVSRIGMALGVSSHRNRGWHATSTAGIFGAAAACGKLLGLGEDGLVWAMGMAGEEACGTWAFLGDGAGCKVLNPAVAASNGAKCAILAKAGMTGPEHVLTVEDGGMLAAMSDSFDVALAAENLGQTWEILKMDNKPYPCCRSTHCVIDGILKLRELYGVRAEAVDHVDVYTYLVGNKQCGMSPGSRRPTIPVEAKFSSPFTAACALVDGRVGLESFTPEHIGKPELQAMVSRVKVITDEAFTDKYPEHWGCRIELFCKDGKNYEITVPDASGSVDNPLTRRQLLEKISGVLGRVLPKDRVEQTMEVLLSLDQAARVPFL